MRAGLAHVAGLHFAASLPETSDLNLVSFFAILIRAVIEPELDPNILEVPSPKAEGVETRSN
jgi:hypothetical protein